MRTRPLGGSMGSSLGELALESWPRRSTRKRWIFCVLESEQEQRHRLRQSSAVALPEQRPRLRFTFASAAPSPSSEQRPRLRFTFARAAPSPSLHLRQRSAFTFASPSPEQRLRHGYTRELGSPYHSGFVLRGGFPLCLYEDTGRMRRGGHTGLGDEAWEEGRSCQRRRDHRGYRGP